MNKRGIITTAVTKEQRIAAYALSNSIKLSNNIETALMVNKLSDVTEKDQETFDYIIEMPYGSYYDVRSNDWQLYWCTPFDSSLFIHPFSLCNINLESAFDFFEFSYNVGFMTNFRRINGYKFNKTEEFFKINGLTKVNANVFYFNKSKESLDYFKLNDPLFQNWRDAQNALINDKQHIKKYFDHNLMHTLTCYGMHEPSDYFVKYDLINNYDMQYETDIMVERKVVEKSWTEKLNYWVTPGNNIKIQNYNLYGILTYHDYTFLTGDIYDYYRTETRKKTVALG